MLSALNYSGGILFKSLSYLYEVVCTNFSAISGLFATFYRNLAKIVAPLVVLLNGQSFPKKNGENNIKMDP